MERCEQAMEALLEARLTGLEEPGSGPVATHLAECANCRAEMEGLSRVWAALGRLPEVSPGDRVRVRLLRRVRRALVRETVLTVGGWVPAVLAAAVGVALSLALSLLVPYPLLVSVCQKVLQLAEGHATPYFVAGAAYGVPLALGAWVLRRRLPRGGMIGGLEATALFLVILAPYVIAECREFAPALRAAFVSGLGGGAVVSSLVGLALARLALAKRAHA